MKGGGGLYAPLCALSLKRPCRLRVPSAVVTGCVFKVTVLYQLGIQSAVGSIADVFKENTHQLV